MIGQWRGVIRASIIIFNLARTSFSTASTDPLATEVR